MKIFLALFIFITSTFDLKAEIVENISLITPMPYKSESSSSQTLKSKIIVTAGDLVNYDVKKVVKDKIAPYNKDLSGMFSSNSELETFIDNIVTDGKNSILGTNMSDAKLIKFFEFLGDKLIGGIADKILSSKGVQDSSRREIWVKKILKPFNACIGSSKNSIYDAGHCMDALISSFVPSVGIGLVYELSKSNLSGSTPADQAEAFNLDQVSYYKDCFKKSSGKASDVNECVLSSMRNGVLKITDSRLSEVINRSSSTPQIALVIKQSVKPTFSQCTNKVGLDKNDKTELNTQFMNCIDDLVKSTGTLIVRDQISSNPVIKSNFSKIEIDNLLKQKVQYFKSCVDEKKKNNARKAGMLDTSHCENNIKNDLTYKVVLKLLSQTAADTSKDDAKKVSALSAEGKRLLDFCWDNNQASSTRESCLKKTIVAFSRKITAEKLDKSIPNDLAIKKELTASSFEQIESCLIKELPTNISEAPNLSAQISICSDKLTKDVAKTVARESLKTKADENKMSEGETTSLIDSLVENKFAACIGDHPTNTNLETCSIELKKNATMIIGSKKIQSNAKGKISSEESSQLVNSLVNQRFVSCLGSKPDDGKINICTADLTKEATKSIVLSYEKKQIKEQINADKTPSQLKPVEDQFIACMNAPSKPENNSAALDECTKVFSLDFARILGALKLTSLMESVLGTQHFNEQKSIIDSMLDKYNECLDDLTKYSLNDGLLDKLNICTSGLERRGVNFVTDTFNSWMSTEEKDAATTMVKNQFASFLPCLSGLMPAAPYSQRLQQNVDSALKPMAILISQFIEYSPENAKQSIEQIINKLTGQLKDVDKNPESRKELIYLLYQNGALDQFLKSMVRAQVKEAIEKMPETEMPKALRALLLSKENFDKIFSSEEGNVIKELVMDKILKPALLEQASLSSPAMIAGMDAIKGRVTKMLVYSPDFGDQIIKVSIQDKINDMNGFTKVIAKLIYGPNSLDWEKVRMTKNGKAAEEYIRDNFLLPKFKGEKLSSAEEKNIMLETEKLVKIAVINYE